MLYIGNPPKGEMSQSALLKDQNTKTSLYKLSKNHWIIAFFMNFWVHQKKIAIYSLFVTTCNSSFKSVSSQKANDSNLTIVEEYLSCHGFGGLEVNIFFSFPTNAVRHHHHFLYNSQNQMHFAIFSCLCNCILVQLSVVVLLDSHNDLACRRSRSKLLSTRITCIYAHLKIREP